jgi:cytochrome c oxidase subunit 2
MQSGFPLFPESASTVAGKVDALYLFLVAMSAFFTVLIAASVIYCAIRYRRKSPDEVGGSFHASMLLEITWTIIPLLIVLFVFFWGARVFFIQVRPPAGALEIAATGKQWMWRFQHPDGQREINELHVPVGQPVRVEMIAEDVLHSLYVPAFRVKMDVVPGRYTTLWFEATKAGTFHLFCTEYCGTEHSKMIGSVTAMEPEAYERWLAGGAPDDKPPAEAGAELFRNIGCDTCHLEGGGGRGPSLRGVFGTEVQLASGRSATADLSYLRRSILDPAADVVAGYQPIMPTYRGQISEENIFRLVSYIRSLSAGREGGATASETLGTPGQHGTTPAAAASPAAPQAAAPQSTPAAPAGGTEGTR